MHNIATPKIKIFLNCFVRDTSKRDRLVDLYIHHRNLYNKGQAELGFIRNIFSVQGVMVAYLFFKELLPDIPIWIIFSALALFVALKVAAQWAVGYWWDKFKWFHREKRWLNKRDEIAENVSRQLLHGQGLGD